MRSDDTQKAPGEGLAHTQWSSPAKRRTRCQITNKNNDLSWVLRSLHALHHVILRTAPSWGIVSLARKLCSERTTHQRWESQPVALRALNCCKNGIIWHKSQPWPVFKAKGLQLPMEGAIAVLPAALSTVAPRPPEHSSHGAQSQLRAFTRWSLWLCLIFFCKRVSFGWITYLTLPTYTNPFSILGGFVYWFILALLLTFQKSVYIPPPLESFPPCPSVGWVGLLWASRLLCHASVWSHVFFGAQPPLSTGLEILEHRHWRSGLLSTGLVPRWHSTMLTEWTHVSNWPLCFFAHGHALA